MGLMLQGRHADSTELFDRLLTVLAEHIKLPLIQVSHLSELARTSDNPSAHLYDIETTAAAAVQLVDGYLLSQELARQKHNLPLEPVAIPAVLEDAMHRLHQLAKAYECDLQIHTRQAHNPVLAHRAALEMALTNLGHAFVQSHNQSEEGKRIVVTLAAHRTHNGVAAGIFTNVEGLSDKALFRAKQLYGKASQPLHEALPGSSAGVFIADSIFASMSTRLRFANHEHVPGLAATLAPSRQLSLV